MHVFILVNMKKILVFFTLAVSLSVVSHAQFLNYGVRAGAGFGTHVDDLAVNTPILAANIGGFVSFGFTQSQSLLAENFYLQTGLNLIRRGSNFREVLEMAMSIREGYYDAWYAQIPILATFHYELPIRQPGHFALLSVGPAVSYGLFGKYYDRKFTRGLPQEAWNYENPKPVFNVANRLDVDFLLGVGYEYQDLSVMLQLDYGFLAVAEEPDALKRITGLDEKATVPMGNNIALLLTIGYQFPIR